MSWYTPNVYMMYTQCIWLIYSPFLGPPKLAFLISALYFCILTFFDLYLNVFTMYIGVYRCIHSVYSPFLNFGNIYLRFYACVSSLILTLFIDSLLADSKIKKFGPLWPKWNAEGGWKPMRLGRIHARKEHKEKYTLASICKGSSKVTT